MKFITTLVLVLSSSASSFASPVSESDISFDQARDSAIQELDELAADIETSPSEERARKKLERRFNRQFAKFSKRIHSIVDRYSEKELRISLLNYTVRNGALIDDLAPNAKGHDPIEGILMHSPEGDLKSALLTLASDTRKAELHDRLNAEIEKAGSARAYLKHTRATLRSMNGCLLKRIALIGIAIPAGTALFIGSVGLGMALTYGGYIGGTSAWGTLGIMAASFLTGTGGTYESFEHLKSYKGNCRLEKRR